MQNRLTDTENKLAREKSKEMKGDVRNLGLTDITIHTMDRQQRFTV